MNLRRGTTDRTSILEGESPGHGRASVSMKAAPEGKGSLFGYLLTAVCYMVLVRKALSAKAKSPADTRETDVRVKCDKTFSRPSVLPGQSSTCFVAFPRFQRFCASFRTLQGGNKRTNPFLLLDFSWIRFPQVANLRRISSATNNSVQS